MCMSVLYVYVYMAIAQVLIAQSDKAWFLKVLQHGGRCANINMQNEHVNITDLDMRVFYIYSRRMACICKLDRQSAEGILVAISHFDLVLIHTLHHQHIHACAIESESQQHS